MAELGHDGRSRGNHLERVGHVEMDAIPTSRRYGRERQRDS